MRLNRTSARPILLPGFAHPGDRGIGGAQGSGPLLRSGGLSCQIHHSVLRKTLAHLGISAGTHKLNCSSSILRWLALLRIAIYRILVPSTMSCLRYLGSASTHRVLNTHISISEPSITEHQALQICADILPLPAGRSTNGGRMPCLATCDRDGRGDWSGSDRLRWWLDATHIEI